MRTLMTGVLLLATAFPAVANAQSARELRNDRRDIRQERRELQQARRYGDRHDIREERRDVRGARQEYREDLRDRNQRWGRNDWQGWRNQHRSLYARGTWRAPFRYTTFRPGVRIQSVYYGPRYVIADPWRYRLPIARPGTRWVRHYNDVILVDYRRGYVIDVIRNFYW